MKSECFVKVETNCSATDKGKCSATSELITKSKLLFKSNDSFKSLATKFFSAIAKESLLT
jgi:hypothetical protein